MTDTRICPVAGCGTDPVVQWRRRPTDAELGTVLARAATLSTDGEPEQPAGLAPPPTAATTVVAVQACGRHAIGMDLAARIHSANCTAPDPEHLPGCGCTPEPLPAQTPPSTQDTIELTTGWTLPA
ncbi:hypothetical protein KCMC57_64030 (plasmid) [Kitasatospora sp. CMC57]|uniref:Uncharacterized protein n=1 Tax=Kitasatospora sp. CMC57 TaxID=3231513 RepID=A0AB33KF06_9ACTN